MATRRPRFKPTAILKTRRPANVDVNIVKEEPEQKCNTPQTEAIEKIVESPLPEPVKIDRPETTLDPKQEAITKTEAPPPDVKPVIGGARRILKPAICIPVRKRRPVDVKAATDADVQPAVLNNVKTEAVVVVAPPPENIVEEPEAITQETHFKSPFMSPSMQQHTQQKRTDSVYNPMLSEYDRKENSSADERSPMSPVKVRQRIRPTPCFNRRNSMQVRII